MNTENEIYGKVCMSYYVSHGKLKECIEIIDELKANDIYTIRKIFPE